MEISEFEKIKRELEAPAKPDLYTRFQTQKVIIEIHDTDYGIEGHIQHANETYIIFVPVEKTRHPLLIPWTSIYTIRLTKKKGTKP